MTGIILASHGGLAEGVKQSAGMVFGPQEDLVAVTLLPEDGPDKFREKLLAAVESLSNKDEVIFLAGWHTIQSVQRDSERPRGQVGYRYRPQPANADYCIGRAHG